MSAALSGEKCKLTKELLRGEVILFPAALPATAMAWRMVRQLTASPPPAHVSREA